MKNFIKIAFFSLIVFTMTMCACGNSTLTQKSETPPTEHISEVDDIIQYEVVGQLMISNIAEKRHFEVFDGCIVNVTKEDNPNTFDKLNFDLLNDNEDYVEIIVRMGKLNNGTEIKGSVNYGKLKHHKKL